MVKEILNNIWTKKTSKAKQEDNTQQKQKQKQKNQPKHTNQLHSFTCFFLEFQSFLLLLAPDCSFCYCRWLAVDVCFCCSFFLLLLSLVLFFSFCMHTFDVCFLLTVLNALSFCCCSNMQKHAEVAAIAIGIMLAWLALLLHMD